MRPQHLSPVVSRRSMRQQILSPVDSTRRMGPQLSIHILTQEYGTTALKSCRFPQEYGATDLKFHRLNQAYRTTALHSRTQKYVRHLSSPILPQEYRTTVRYCCSAFYSKEYFLCDGRPMTKVRYRYFLRYIFGGKSQIKISLIKF